MLFSMAFWRACATTSVLSSVVHHVLARPATADDIVVPEVELWDDDGTEVGESPWYMPHRPCTYDSATVRREWNDMTRDDRLSFIAAVQCLKSRPSRLQPGFVPAAVSQYDDFTATHINMSFTIHFSGLFLSWHRRFVHVFEEQLYECGYPRGLGTPYWDWTRNPDIDRAAMFDGSDESLGGNGVWDPEARPIALGKNGFLPRGTGGGCVTTGPSPFAGERIRFGPFPGSVLAQGYLPANWTQPNERCLTRDLNPIIAANSLNSTFTTQLLAARNISQVQVLLTPPDFGLDFLGLHRAGHCALGDIMADFFASPQDIGFYLHHAAVDRIWTAWQDMDPAARRYVYNGTSTIFNPVGVTAEVDNSTVFGMGILAPPMTLEQGADPMSGMYCYRYE